MKTLSIRVILALLFCGFLQTTSIAETATTTKAETTEKKPAKKETKEAPKKEAKQANSVQPKQSDENTERFKDWALGCDEIEKGSKEQCYIYQTVINQENNRPILQVAAGYLPIRDQDVQPAALFTLPLGVFLAQGVSVSVDSAPAIRFPYEQCTNVGCSAILPLDSKMLSQFKKGNKADIIVDEGARLLVIELSLSGFTAGFKKVAAAQK